ncbi:Mu transposase C-terminal domain-containing protein [Streptomyces sp. SP2-10]|uniref:Mu transposase C-terminal domain-containing protein n=1 Tax=Streptomyces sp. SP2-10 TaxID=2873385 RepID=UPI001CA759F0|nr:Mu transposase C-terminal domain-containing protein [Streptomyces sp. SP2-10]MBY8841907.1 Mu transposase C-terminal domain-containing protein [Streptomyces sp. SP2-10]
MSSHRLATADWVEFEDELHQVAGLDGLTVRLRSETGRMQTIMLAVLLADDSFRAAVEPPPRTLEENGPALDPAAVLDGLDEDAKKAALELEGHLLEAVTGYRSGDPLTPEPGEPRPSYNPADPALTQRARIQAKAAELGVSDRWLWKLWARRTEQGLWGLVDKRKARIRNPLRNLDPRVIQAIRDQAAAERADSTATIGSRFMRRTQNRLDADHGVGTVLLPGRDTFRRAVAHLLDISPAAPAYRRASAANQPDRPFGNVLATRPGEVVMLDTTPLDVLAFDPGSGGTISVELTIALDVATRSILAWRLTPLGTKAIDIGLLLADTMTPELMRPGWDDALRYQMLRIPAERLISVDERLAEAAARPVIYPETLLYDHGKPYKSDVVERACARWKIDLQDARKLKPTDKPHVERLFLTVRQQYSEHVAGYKGFNVAHRGRTVEEQARWSIDELAEFFAEYVIAVYQRTHHRGLTLQGFPDLHVSPNEAYAMALGAAGFVDCPREANMYFELLPIAGRVIHPYGIELNHLTYNAEILYRYRKAKSPYPDGLWPIRFDPRNLLHAYFLDPADGRWHVLRWTHALAEHQPFTDITLREAKRLIALRERAPEDQEEVARALTELQNRTDAPETWTRTDRKRHTRDQHRAAAQTRDKARSDAPVDDHPPLAAVPAPFEADAEPAGWGEIDLSRIEAAQVFDPDAS